MNEIQSRSEKAVGQLLRKSGLQFAQLSDVSVASIRQAMRGAVPGMRVTHLSPDLRQRFLEMPITQDLLCTRTGFHQAPATHYLPRPSGSYDCIFIYNVGGRGWIEMAGRSWTVEKYDGLLIPAHRAHVYGADPDNPWKTYWVHFQGKQSGQFAEMLVPDLRSPVIHLPQHQEITACIEQLYQYMSQVHTYLMLVAAAGALGQLLGTLLLNMRATERRSRTAEENLEKVVHFMRRNMARRLSLKELGAVAGMNPNHFATLFSRKYESPPIDYFNRLKIQRACELLATTDLAIAEIAEQLGFSDPFYFSRLFKKIMGVSPRTYR